MKKRNPIAKAVTRIRPKVIPDKRAKLKEKAEKRETTNREGLERDEII